MVENFLSMYVGGTIVLTLALIALGVLWVPVGCLICGVIAHSKGLEVRLWVKRAAISSALLFLPWFYVVARVSELRVPSFLKVAAYGLVYLAWLAGPIAFTLLYAIQPVADLWQEGGKGLAEFSYFYFTLGIALTLANLWAWFISLRALFRSRRVGKAEFDFVYFWPWFLVIVSWLGVLLLAIGFLMVDVQDSYLRRAGS